MKKLIAVLVLVCLVGGCSQKSTQMHNFEWRFMLTNGFEIHRNVSQSADVAATSESSFELSQSASEWIFGGDGDSDGESDGG